MAITPASSQSSRWAISRRPSGLVPPRAGRIWRRGLRGTSRFSSDVFAVVFGIGSPRAPSAGAGTAAKGRNANHWPTRENRASSTPNRALSMKLRTAASRLACFAPPLAPRPVSGCPASSSRRPSRGSPMTASTTTAASSPRPISKMARSATTTSRAPIPASGRSKGHVLHVLRKRAGRLFLRRARRRELLHLLRNRRRPGRRRSSPATPGPRAGGTGRAGSRRARLRRERRSRLRRPNSGRLPVFSSNSSTTAGDSRGNPPASRPWSARHRAAGDSPPR